MNGTPPSSRQCDKHLARGHRSAPGLWQGFVVHSILRLRNFLPCDAAGRVEVDGAWVPAASDGIHCIESIEDGVDKRELDGWMRARRSGQLSSSGNHLKNLHWTC